MQTIVLKALAKERERRYQSAGGLARDLNLYLIGEPIEAKRGSAMYVLKKALSRYKAADARDRRLLSESRIGNGIAEQIIDRLPVQGIILSTKTPISSAE